MLAMRLFWTALLVGLLVLHFLRQLWSRRSYPSGPLPLPLMGGMWRIGTRLYQDTFLKLKKEPGNNEPSATPFLTAVTNEKDLVFSNGDIWKQQKKIGQATMQKLEHGKKSMEHQIKEEAQKLVETFACAKGQPLDPLLPVANSVCNVVCAVAFGHRFPTDDETFQRLVKDIDLALKAGGSFIYALYRLFPRAMRCLPGPQKKALSSRKAVLSFVQKEIKKHKECQLRHEPQDFVDFYLIQIEKAKGRVGSTYDEEQLAECILDLFISATETTATSLQWALLLMAIHPDIQDKVYKEMEDVLGPSHSIAYQDWQQLPYTCAVIHEIQRSKYAFLFGIIRQAAKDVNLLGFLMPKGTFINPNLNSALLDPKQWETPEKFNPNHFLDKSGKFVAREEFQLFGSGDPTCLEEQLARIELFSFFSALLKAFRFRLPGGEKKLNTEPRTGLTTYPHSYQLCALPHCQAS
ncbi:cytochrome P450 2J5-like [Sceloporus undulatus]|uniref:cytochrome P450 2J5-like n=1 Tax=Sceloporus undulatus TaxID=8520 RepID=UPI001C4CF0E3|nr:cytochrome P450 2J5-like [Sceloporus undulatus]